MAESERSPSAEEVRAQLERLLASHVLAGSERSRALLRHVVEAALEGRASELKAYTIALDALGRRGGPDAQAESAVRVEASRLRRKLLHYYLTDGAEDPVRIELPPQGYVPVIRYAHPPRAPAEAAAAAPWHGRLAVPAAALLLGFLAGAALGLGTARLLAPSGPPVEPSAAAPASLPEGPRVGVRPFVDLTGEPRLSLLARGMAEALISRLARDPRLIVVARGEEDRPAPALPADYLVEGTLRADPDRIRLAVSLVADVDRRILWREDFDRPRTAASLIALEEELAEAILRSFARARGGDLGLPGAALPAVPRDLAAYECVLEAAAYRRRRSPELHVLVRGCLERAVVEEPGFAEAWARLALVRLDEHFLRVDPGPDPLGRAAEAVEQALRLDPTAATSQRAAMAVAFARGDLDAFHRAAERGLALEPRHPELLAAYAQKLAWLGQWPKARGHIVQALLLDHDPPDWYRTVLVLDACRRGAWLDALGHLLAMREQEAFEPSWLRAVVLARLGDAVGARDALRRARAQARDLLATVEEDLARRRTAPDLRAVLLDGLRAAAGAPAPTPAER